MAEMTMPSAVLGSLFEWWQIPAVLVLIALIVFWVMYRRRQM